MREADGKGQREWQRVIKHVSESSRYVGSAHDTAGEAARSVVAARDTAREGDLVRNSRGEAAVDSGEGPPDVQEGYRRGRQVGDIIGVRYSGGASNTRERPAGCIGGWGKRVLHTGRASARSLGSARDRPGGRVRYRRGGSVWDIAREVGSVRCGRQGSGSTIHRRVRARYSRGGSSG